MQLVIRVSRGPDPVMHGTPEWYAARREFIGSSEVSDIMGHGYIDTKPNKTPAEQEAARKHARNQVIMRKAGLADEWTGNETADMGTDMEAGFINVARRRWGWELKPWGSLVYDKIEPRLACTPDFYVEAPWGRGLVQCKLTTAQAQEDCKPGKDGKPSQATYAEGPPMRYVLQKQAELACCDLEWNALFVVHCSGGHFKPRLYPVRRHEGVILAIRREVRRAWEDVERMRRGEIA